MDIAYSRRLNERYFNNKRNGVFMEAGASDGTVHSICVWFEKSFGWTGINIEPHPLYFERLVKNRPNSVNVNCALSDREITVELTTPIKNGKVIYGHSTISTRVKNKWKGEVWWNAVQTRTYSSIIEEHKVKKLDLFVLDVEGVEISVLNDFYNCDVLPYVLAVETNKTPKEDILDLIGPLGYKLDYNDKYDSYFVRETDG